MLLGSVSHYPITHEPLEMVWGIQSPTASNPKAPTDEKTLGRE